MGISKVTSEYKGFKKEIYILFVARIINRLGSFVNLFLVLYLTQNLKLNGKAIGIILTIVGVSRITGTMISGKLADYFGRKKVLVILYVSSALFIISCGFINGSNLIPILLIIATFFLGGIRPVFNSIITDLSTPEERKRVFSFFYLATNIGVSLGPIIAGLLYRNYVNWIFWGDGTTTLIATILIIIYVKDTTPTAEDISNAKGNEKATDESSLKVIIKKPFLIVFVLLNIVGTFIYAQHMIVIPIQFSEMFGKNSGKYFGYIMSLNAIVVVVFTTYILKLTKNKTSDYNMFLGTILYTVGFGMLYFANKNLMIFIISTILWSIGEILYVTNYGVYISLHTPITHRGRFNSIFGTLNMIGFTIAPLISGFMISNYGVKNVWEIIFYIGFVLTIFFYGFTKLKNV
ncbi:MFS transporter [Haliovirga abyssi]|uniref:MFS transporter n=1 Tax=Haliovirga abyssi TaxID=2996794 RepID=A0AAU9DB60_9FUSO|nr:MFS transporter [Haliovirga abyssi]BDU50515.1 MFS transporter [Haliovirga abyssi]